MTSALSQPHFHDEAKAFAYVEARVWPEGPICPHCGGVDRISRMGGKSTRIGALKCYQCRKPFTVKVGTVFESSHVPMRLWLQVRARSTVELWPLCEHEERRRYLRLPSDHRSPVLRSQHTHCR